MRIELKGLSMDFGEVKAVDKLNMIIEKGELVSLLGPSGCGKSTTLFMLAGIHKPTDGDIFFGDRQVTKLEPQDRKVGMVFQNYALYPHMTVEENIMFPLTMQKVKKNIRREEAAKMAKLVKIDHLLKRKPNQLSGGQQQRVAIARALAKKPEVLLLDEPLSNLDAKLRLETREEIRRIQQETGVTTIFVTHDQEEAMSISDKVLLMKEGKHQQFSKPQDMYDYPKNIFVASFLGNPPINTLPASWKRPFESIQIAGMDREIALENVKEQWKEEIRDLTVGIRPENWFVTEEEDKTVFEGTVVHKETIGRDTMIRVKNNGEDIRALVTADIDIVMDKKISLGVRKGKIQIFDRLSGENIEKISL